MTFKEHFQRAACEQSLANKTRECYLWHCRKAYGHIQQPVTQWTGENVRAWLVQMETQRYSPVTRKQALCAITELSP